MAAVVAARKRELIERVSAQIVAWNLREPALVFLTMHAPLAFFGSQFLIAAQPFLGILGENSFARDFALLLEDPQTVQELITRLENKSLPA